MNTICYSFRLIRTQSQPIFTSMNIVVHNTIDRNKFLFLIIVFKIGVWGNSSSESRIAKLTLLLPH